MSDPDKAGLELAKRTELQVKASSSSFQEYQQEWELVNRLEDAQLELSDWSASVLDEEMATAQEKLSGATEATNDLITKDQDNVMLQSEFASTKVVAFPELEAAHGESMAGDFKTLENEIHRLKTMNENLSKFFYRTIDANATLESKLRERDRVCALVTQERDELWLKHGETLIELDEWKRKHDDMQRNITFMLTANQNVGTESNAFMVTAAEKLDEREADTCETDAEDVEDEPTAKRSDQETKSGHSDLKCTDDLLLNNGTVGAVACQCICVTRVQNASAAAFPQAPSLFASGTIDTDATVDVVTAKPPAPEAHIVQPNHVTEPGNINTDVEFENVTAAAEESINDVQKQFSFPPVSEASFVQPYCLVANLVPTTIVDWTRNDTIVTIEESKQKRNGIQERFPTAPETSIVQPSQVKVPKSFAADTIATDATVDAVPVTLEESRRKLNDIQKSFPFAPAPEPSFVQAHYLQSPTYFVGGTVNTDATFDMTATLEDLAMRLEVQSEQIGKPNKILPETSSTTAEFEDSPGGVLQARLTRLTERFKRLTTTFAEQKGHISRTELNEGGS